MKNVERNLVGLILVAAVAIGAGWMVTGCGSDEPGVGPVRLPCDVCDPVAPDAGHDAS